MSVETKDDLIAVIFELFDDNDAGEWQAQTVYTYLQSLAAWLDNKSNVAPTWQLFAEVLQAARTVQENSFTESSEDFSNTL
jgi:hypothetical protein